MRNPILAEKRITSDDIIFIVSDVHLGYRNANGELFKNYLNKILDANPGDKFWCNYLVLAGDIFELWRKKITDTIFETKEIQSILQRINEKVNTQVFFIVGNHDYIFRGDEYDEEFKNQNIKKPNFSFHLGLQLNYENNQNSIHILHGDEFDLIQPESAFDHLCKTEEDFSSIWEKLPDRLRIFTEALKSKPDSNSIKNEDRVLKKVQSISDEDILSENDRQILREFFHLPPHLDFSVKEYKNLIRVSFSPEDRFHNMLEPTKETDIPLILKRIKRRMLETRKFAPGIVKRAKNYAKKKKCILIFGHTHKPFIGFDDEDKTIFANSGSWVEWTPKEKEIFKGGLWSETSLSISNTFISIKDQSISLKEFKNDEEIVDDIQTHKFY